MEALLALATINATQTSLAILSTLHLTNVLWPQQTVVKEQECFDYIVMGSGAGGVVAARLAEDPKVKVLLVEAGNPPSIQSELPGLFVLLQNSGEDLQYKSQEEVATSSQRNNVFKLAAGKVLGGSSSIDHFIYLRGDPSDFDRWAEITNDKSWEYEEVLAYYKKNEHLIDDEILSSEYAPYHSTQGPFIVTRELHTTADKFLEAFAELGKPITLDLNGNYTKGYTQPTLSVGNGKRQSVAEAYLRNPIPNLHILYDTVATKINFEDNTAVSVNVFNNDKTITLKAAKEIIVSAGVFGTPKLLMVSGVGPEEDLIPLGIEVIKDLPVGQNLQDHVAVQLVFKLEESIAIPPPMIPTMVGLPIVIGADSLDPLKTIPEYQTTNIAVTHDTPNLLLICTQIFGYATDICQEIYNSCRGRNTLYSLVAKLQSNSKGTVKLSGKNFSDELIINQNFYEIQSDFDDMVNYIQDFITLLNTTYFKEVKAELVNVQFDDCEGNFDDINYIKCYIKHMSTTLYHQTSTCPMGTVVDSKLKVLGLERLRVVDASVMPDITHANPLATTLMIAEKAADIIKTESDNYEDICSK